MRIDQLADRAATELHDATGRAEFTVVAPGSGRVWRRVAAVAAVLLVAVAIGGTAWLMDGDGPGEVASGSSGFGDGVFSIEKEIAAAGDLTLILQPSNIGDCLEVRTADGQMSGGCGLDLTEPISVAVGSIDGSDFASGWAPAGTAQVLLAFAGGENVTVTELTSVAGYEVVFFIVSPVPAPGSEPLLPEMAIAYDDAGGELARIDYQDHGGRGSNTPPDDAD